MHKIKTKSIMLTAFLSFALLLLSGCDSNKKPYAEAEALFINGSYIEAADAFNSLDDYKDAATRANESLYMNAEKLFNNGMFTEASDTFLALGEYRDSPDRAKQSRYSHADFLFTDGMFLESADVFSALGNYKDSPERAVKAVNEMNYITAIEYVDKNEYAKAKEILSEIREYKDSAEIINGIIYKEALILISSGNYKGAIDVLNGIADYLDAKDKIELCNLNLEYIKAIDNFNNDKREQAYQQFVDLGYFNESIKYVKYMDALADSENEDYVESITKFVSLGSFLDSPSLLKANEYFYYDQQYKSGVTDLSGLPDFPLYDSIYLRYKNEWRVKRLAAVRTELEDYAHAAYFAKNDSSVSPVKVTGNGLYVNNSDRRFGVGPLIDKVNEDMPVFFLADSIENIRYVMNFVSSTRQAGTYTDNAKAYEVYTTVTIKDTVTGRSLFKKGYTAYVPYSKSHPGDAYGEHYFFSIPVDENDNVIGVSDYEKDILPVLNKLLP